LRGEGRGEGFKFVHREVATSRSGACCMTGPGLVLLVLFVLLGAVSEDCLSEGNVGTSLPSLAACALPA
jgi:hypothetical protein